MKFILDVTNYGDLSEREIDELHISEDSNGDIINKDGTRACVEINTMAELKNFTSKFGHIIINCLPGNTSEEPDEMYLEIYNDYRE
ncbi:MAG: hypothetical protein M0R51_15140 [Clostridia bacterium]|jgi:hypothetical protein|nr:hypothetical protein [Clostridia bacterium]